ncbi:MAG: hypothetical protein R6W77_15465 [Trueperaceae bacterium]
MRRAARAPGTALRNALLLLGLVLAAGPAVSAQPYAADGGFGRPFEVLAGDAVPAAGVAIDAAGDVVVAFADDRGVWTHRPSDEAAGPTLIARTDAVRQVTAGAVGGSVAVAWIERDRTTGESRHFLAWNGATAELFRDRVAVPMRVVDLGGRPWVLIGRRMTGFSEIVLLEATPQAGTRGERLLHRTELSVRGADVVLHQDGTASLAWLEGKTDRTEFGLVAEWDAYFALVPPNAPVASGPVSALGAADVVDERQRVAIAATSDGAVVAWPGEDGQVRVTEVTFDATGGARTTREHAFEGGRPLAVTPSYAYWVTTEAIRRAALPEAAAAAAGGPAIVSVAWSPVTIAGAAFAASAREASSTGDGAPGAPAPGLASSSTAEVHALAWHGRLQGGGVAVYGSDDRVAFRPTWRDRLAAAMGWRPWALWEEVAGQALTAVVVGVVVTVATAPLLWLLALVALPLAGRTLLAADRLAVDRASDAQRMRAAARKVANATARLGAGLGLLPLALATAVLAWRGAAFGQRPLATLTFLAVVAVTSSMIGFGVGRRGDHEPQFTVVLSAVVTAWVGATVVAFTTYRTWAPVLGLA